MSRTALVTGGSRGIGRAIASSLLASGTDVMISGRDEVALRAAAEQLASVAAEKGARIEAFSADVREYSQVAALVQATVDRLGGLDILINNAAVGILVEAAEMSLDAWHESIATNLNGVFYCCREAIPHMKRRGGGWIINISSLAGKNPFAGGAAYCATKAGLNAFSEALMQELRYEDIRVSYVMPGSVRTGFGGHSEEAGADWKLDADDVAQVVVDLLAHDRRSLPSRVEIRPSKPRKR
jgi:NAD(P)-dependent dehydrogenase (short-subunit alcohol dehydrogenase family)